MSAPAPSPPRNRRRLLLRLAVRGLVAGLLLGLAGGVYLVQVGVPGLVRDAVSRALQQQGVALNFQRLRLQGALGLVAEQVSVAGRQGAEGPELWFEEVRLTPQWSGLWRQGTLEIRRLGLQGGRLTLPVPRPAAAPEIVVVDQIQAQLDLADFRVWRVENVSARFRDITVRAHGTVTNAPALGRARTAPAAPAAAVGRGTWPDLLRSLRGWLAQLTFESPPPVHVQFTGDVLRAGSWRVEMRAGPAVVDTPWGRARAAQLTARWNGSPAADVPHLRAEAAWDHVAGPWGEAEDLRARVRGDLAPGGDRPGRLEVEVEAAALRHAGFRVNQPRLTVRTTWPATETAAVSAVEWSAVAVQTPWADASRLEGCARVGHAPGGLLRTPREVEGGLRAEAVGRRDVAAAGFELDFTGRPVNPAAAADASAGESGPAGWEAAATVRAMRLRWGELEVPRCRAEVVWRHPLLRLDRLEAEVLDGRLRVTDGRWEVPSGEIGAEVALDFDVQKLDRLLPAAARTWLAQFHYSQPPEVAASVRWRLPSGREIPDAAPGELLGPLEVRARLEGREVRYRELLCSRGAVTLTLSNQVLHLRDLVVERPEGRAELACDLDLRTREFRWQVQCALDAAAAAPVVDDALVPVVERFTFSAPPHVSGTVWGRWGPMPRVAFELEVAATNFTFQGEAFDAFTTRLRGEPQRYTFTGARLSRGAEGLEAPWAEWDAARHGVTLSNLTAVMDAGVLARAIGPGVAALLAPYRFAGPTRLRAAGVVPTGAGGPEADLVVDVAGGPFACWRFRLPEVSAAVHWRGGRVSVTNATAAFYGGRLSGGLDADLGAGGEARLHFQAQATEFDLQALLRDVLPESTNRIEGLTTVALIVTEARASDWQSWHGRGHAEMRNGLLWDLPIFGLLSRALNLVVPGLGNSRATAARATFRIERSVIYTDDLAIEAGPARLQYRGWVDFKGRVQARVVAEVLHRTPVIGPLISLVLTPVAMVLEYQVTGTLAAPEIKPLRVPGFLRPLLNPLGTLQNLVSPPGP